MIRVLVENLLLFLLPTFLYVSFGMLVSKDGSASAVLGRAPVLVLAAIGAVLVFTVLTLFGHSGDGKPGQTYEPPVYKDGKLVPGHMK